MLSTTYMPDIKFHSVILAEPMIVRKPRPGELDFDIVEAAIKRKDIWPTRADALRYFQRSVSCHGWDAQILEKYAVRAPTSITQVLGSAHASLGTRPA